MSAGWARRPAARPLFSGVTVALASAAPAMAEVCDKVRPGWAPGTDVTALGEAIYLFSTLPVLLLLLATGIALRFRSQWGGLAVTVLWCVLVSVIAMDLFGQDTTGIRQAAIQEGCIGSPTLFIALVTAICIATILYTAPLRERSAD